MNQESTVASPEVGTDNSASIAVSLPADSPVVAQLRVAFEEAIASKEFTSSTNHVKKALKALEVPDLEARFAKQFRDVAIRNLLSDAAKKSDGTSVPYPTDDAINTELNRLLANRKAKLAAA